MVTIRTGKGNKARRVPLNRSARQAFAEYARLFSILRRRSKPSPPLHTANNHQQMCLKIIVGVEYEL